MPIRFDKWNSAYDPREAQLRGLFGQPPSPDDIVKGVSDAFAGDLARIFGTRQGGDEVAPPPGPLID